MLFEFLSVKNIRGKIYSFTYESMNFLRRKFRSLHLESLDPDRPLFCFLKDEFY